MGFNKHHSLRVADRVLSHLEGFLEEFDVLDKEAGTISCYANGREQGYHIQVWPEDKNIENWRGVSFSEHRNSDDIVIYFGKVTKADFEYAGNVPSEAVYKNARHYPYGAEQDAAHAIAKYLWGGDTEVPKAKALERAFP